MYKTTPQFIITADGDLGYESGSRSTSLVVAKSGPNGLTSSAAAVLGADTEGTSTQVSSSAVTDELSSKVTALEEKLQTLADLVSTLTEFYTTFDLSSLLKQNQSGSEAENSSLSSAQ